MYHSVSAAGGTLAVPPRLLTEQLSALRHAGYELVGLSEALDRPDDHLLAVTFDDGYRDFLTAGLPVLQDLRIRATLYASTGHLGAHAGWLGPAAPAFGPLLTWDELAEVAASGIVEIG